MFQRKKSLVFLEFGDWAAKSVYGSGSGDDRRDSQLCVAVNTEMPVKLETSPLSVMPTREPRVCSGSPSVCRAEHRLRFRFLRVPFHPYTSLPGKRQTAREASGTWKQKARLPAARRTSSRGQRRDLRAGGGRRLPGNFGCFSRRCVCVCELNH